MMNTQSEMIKSALARAIQNASDDSLRAAAQQLADSSSDADADSQFPPHQPFVRSTFTIS